MNLLFWKQTKKPESIYKEIDEYINWKAARFPCAALSAHDILIDFAHQTNVKRAADITDEKVNQYSDYVYNTHTTFLAESTIRVLRNFRFYFRKSCKQVSLANFERLTYTLDDMNSEIKKYFSEMGKRSWEARKKKYGVRKAVAILDKASKTYHGKLSTVQVAKSNG